MAKVHLNYCFLPGGYHIGHILIGLKRIYGERQVILCRTVINNHIFFVNSLNIFTTCRILRLFPSASKCEIMTLLNKSLLLNWPTMCRFPGATFVFSPITL